MASTARRTWELENQVVQVHGGNFEAFPKHSTDIERCSDDDDDDDDDGYYMLLFWLLYIFMTIILTRCNFLNVDLFYALVA